MLEVGWARRLTLLPFSIGVTKNPDGARLNDVLPPEVYARWRLLKSKYIGDDEGIERERPTFAVQKLSRKVMEQAGLASDTQVRKAIEEMAKKRNIKMTSTQVELTVDDPVTALRDFKKSSLDDVACFSKTLEWLESDMDAMRSRANAWAKGDLEAIQKLDYAERKGVCDAAWASNKVFQARPGLHGIPERMRAAWLAAAEKSLATNSSTFAMLPLGEVLDAKGLVAALEAKGYQVQKPE
jgi:hypothetical protein